MKVLIWAAVSFLAGIVLFYSVFFLPFPAKPESKSKEKEYTSAKVHVGDNYYYVDLEGEMYAAKMEGVKVEGGNVWYSFSMKKVRDE